MRYLIRASLPQGRECTTMLSPAVIHIGLPKVLQQSFCGSWFLPVQAGCNLGLNKVSTMSRWVPKELQSQACTHTGTCKPCSLGQAVIPELGFFLCWQVEAVHQAEHPTALPKGQRRAVPPQLPSPGSLPSRVITLSHGCLPRILPGHPSGHYLNKKE